MGNCASVKVANRQIGLPTPDRTPHPVLSYPQTEVTLIKVKDINQKVVHRDKVMFKFPTSLLSSCSEQTMAGLPCLISSKG